MYVVNVPASGTLQVRVPLVTPPVPCPCVVRVATTDNDARPDATRGDPRRAGERRRPLRRRVSTAADSVVVTSRVSSTKQGWPATWAPWFAGPVHRRLIVSVENRSEAPTPPLKVIAGVGRDVDDGEALPTRSLGVLQPGARRTVSIPVKVSAPTWGDYVVFGRVYGLDAPLRFDRHLETEPWGLELLLPLALFLIAQVVRYKQRRARRATAQVGPRCGRAVGELFTRCWRSCSGALPHLSVPSERAGTCPPRGCSGQRQRPGRG